MDVLGSQMRDGERQERKKERRTEGGRKEGKGRETMVDACNVLVKGAGRTRHRGLFGC